VHPFRQEPGKTGKETDQPPDHGFFMRLDIAADKGYVHPHGNLPPEGKVALLAGLANLFALMTQ